MMEGGNGKRMVQVHNMKRSILLFSFICLILGSPMRAQWLANGNAVFDSSVAGNNEHIPVPAADGYGGIYVVFVDWRAGSDGNDIYIQRMNGDGQVLWRQDAVPVCEAHDVQDFPVIAANGKKGVFVSWLDYRSSSGSYIYAQYFTPDGVAQWTSGGIPVSEATALMEPNITSDGEDGVFISWYAAPTGINNPGVNFVQHLDSKGTMRWGSVGIRLREKPYEIDVVFSDQCRLRADGKGGVYVVWREYPNRRAPLGVPDYHLPYIQHLSFSGEKLWKEAGILLNDSSITKNAAVEILPLRDDGLLQVMWSERKTYPLGYKGPLCDYDIGLYMQRVNEKGEKLFGAKGKWWGGVHYNGFNNYISDGKGGLFFVQMCGYIVRAMRVDSTGHPLWPEFINADKQLRQGFENPVAISDGHGGVMIFWLSRYGGEKKGLYQGFDSAGVRIVSEGPQYFYELPYRHSWIRAVEIEPGVAIVTWNDNRRDKWWSIYAAKITRDGGLTGVPLTHCEVLPAQPLQYPNPAIEGVTIEFDAQESGIHSCIVHDMLGRRVYEEDRIFTSGVSVLWRIDTSTLEPGIYLYRIVRGSHVLTGRFVLTGK